MCTPLGVATAAGVGLNAYAQYQKGQVDSATALANAKLADAQAADATARGAYKARDIEIAGRQEGAAMLAASSAGNVTGPSVDDSLAISAEKAARDATIVKANAAREAWGFKSEAASSRAAAASSRKAGLLGALGSSLSGAATVASVVGDKK